MDLLSDLSPSTLRVNLGHIPSFADPERLFADIGTLDASDASAWISVWREAEDAAGRIDRLLDRLPAASLLNVLRRITGDRELEYDLREEIRPAYEALRFSLLIGPRMPSTLRLSPEMREQLRSPATPLTLLSQALRELDLAVRDWFDQSLGRGKIFKNALREALAQLRAKCERSIHSNLFLQTRDELQQAMLKVDRVGAIKTQLLDSIAPPLLILEGLAWLYRQQSFEHMVDQTFGTGARGTIRPEGFLDRWTGIKAKDYANFFSPRIHPAQPELRTLLPKLYQLEDDESGGEELSLLDKLCGLPDEPASAAVFGPHGSGKSHLRVAVHWALCHGRDEFVLELDSLPTPKELPRKLAEAFVDNLGPAGQIRQERREQIKQRIASDPLLQRRIDSLSRSIQPAAAGRLSPAAAQPDEEALWQAALAELGALAGQLAELAARLEIRAVYVLVDSVEGDPEHLRPLLRLPSTAGSFRFAFKLFMDQTLHDQVVELCRSAGIDTHTLQPWRPEPLIHIVDQRIRGFSSDLTVSDLSLQDLCRLSGDTTPLFDLARAAGGFPGPFLSLLKELVEFHCRRAKTADDLIQSATITAFLQDRGQAPPRQVGQYS